MRSIKLLFAPLALAAACTDGPLATQLTSLSGAPPASVREGMRVRAARQGESPAL